MEVLVAPVISKKFLVAMRDIEVEEDDLVWKIPKVSKKGKTFADPYVYVRPWSIPESTAIYLFEEVTNRKPKIILELGTSTGYSTCFLAKAASTHDGHVFTIERFEQKITKAKENFERVGLQEYITLIEQDILSTVKRWDRGEINFLFMDADKQYYTDYFAALTPHFSQDIFVVVDNAGNFSDRMKRFFTYLKEREDEWETTYLDQDNGLLLIERV